MPTTQEAANNLAGTNRLTTQEALNAYGSTVRSFPPTTVTASSTIPEGQVYTRVNSASATNQTLPATNSSNKSYLIKNISTGTVTVVGTIDGVTNYSLATKGKYVRVSWNGTDYDVIGNN